MLALVLVFVARPRGRLRQRRPSSASAWRERLALGWAGLRGAVPVVLATFPVIDGRRRDSVEFFNIVFFAVLVSTAAAGHRRSSRSRGGSG